jgi:hypothetical protein
MQAFASQLRKFACVILSMMLQCIKYILVAHVRHVNEWHHVNEYIDSQLGLAR